MGYYKGKQTNQNNQSPKLMYKLHIRGELVAETGLHIGGSEVELEIGGLDNEVIKVRQGDKRVPYIPGSSLKGKLRTLLGRYYGKATPETDEMIVKQLFGVSPNPKKNQPIILSRLIVRDCYAVDAGQVKTEEKAENTINRISGVANPRSMERVVKGAVFNLDMILDVYKGDHEGQLLQTLDLGFQLLVRDYLGGGGTRGSGKVRVSNLRIEKIRFLKDGTVEKSLHEDFKFNANEE